MARPPSALYIDEILATVLHHVCERRKLKDVRQTLARVALTCRAFSDPALDALWEQQHSLWPLLKLLPALQPRNDQLVLARPINSDEWARFQQYARRVRTLKYCTTTHVDPAVYACLARLGGGAPLLPCLRRLVWTHATSNDAAAPLLAAPSLAEVDIALAHDVIEIFDPAHDPPHAEDHAAHVFVVQLVAVAPSLRRITLVGPFPRAGIASLKQMQRLEKVDLSMIGHVGHELFVALSAMDALTELAVHVHDLVVDPSQLSRPTFPSLESLTISGAAFSITTSLTMVESTCLRSVVAVSSDDFTTDDALSCARCLGSKFGSSLQRLRLRIYVEFGEPRVADVMSMFEPLLGLRGLVDVNLDVNERVTYIQRRDEGHAAYIRVRDADVEAMARAWPRLEHFYLYHRTSVEDPSMAALASLAKHCPQLVDVALVLKAGSIPSMPASWAPLAHPLRTLRLLGDNMEPADKDGVAQYICRLFPRLERFSAHAWGAAADSAWRDIRRSIEEPAEGGVAGGR